VTIVVDNLLTQYELHGKGQLVLVLHGWGDNGKGLAGLTKSLAKKYQVLAIDLPGFGGTQPPAEAWDLDGYAAFLQELFRKLELKQPYAVVGHSNGGALAIRAAAQHYLEPQKLILLAASGVRTGEPVKRLALKVVAKTGKVVTAPLPERHRRKLRKRLYGVAGSDMLAVPQLQETFKRTVRQDVQGDAAQLKLPTLLVYGRQDRAVPVADGETYHRLIKNSQLEILEEAEHFVHLDQPAKVVELIEEFLA
jgi:pimeloyl-ACP methyl ester carboxylesterase